MVDTTAIMLFTRSKTGLGAIMIDGVEAMLAVVDTTTNATAAAQEAYAVSLAQAAGRALPAGYFDQVSQLAVGAAGPVAAATGQWPLAAVGDNMIFGRFQIDITIASQNSGAEQEVPVND